MINNQQSSKNIRQFWSDCLSSLLLGLTLLVFVVPVWAQAILTATGVGFSGNGSVITFPQNSSQISASLPNPTMLTLSIPSTNINPQGVDYFGASFINRVAVEP